jgi:membrane protein YqaA with SNARE-associated domain
MTIVYVILGGVVGGAFGWLFDRLTRRRIKPVAEDSTKRT